MLWLVCVVALTVLGASPAWAQAPVITSRPLSKAVMEGQAVTMTVGVSDATGVTYQWIRNGKVVPGATSATLTLPSVTLADRGWYRVAVSNASGTATSVLRLEVGANNTSMMIVGSGPAAPVDFGPVLALAAGTWGGLVVALRPDGTVNTLSASNDATLPSGLTGVVGLAVGNSRGVAVKSDGTAVTWGSAGAVPAGLSQVVAVARGHYFTLALKADGTVVFWTDPGNYPSAQLSTVPAGLRDVVAISAGENHCLALLADGSLVGWGNNGSVPSVPAGLTNGVAIASGSDYALVVRSDGTAACLVRPYGSTLNIPTDLTGVTAVAAASSGGIALKADGTMVAFNVGPYRPVMPAGLAGVTAVVADGTYGDYYLALATNNPPVFQVQPQGLAVTPGDYAAFSASAGGLLPLTYRWKHDGVALVNGGTVSGATTANLAIDGVVATDAGSYTVEATNPVGTVSSNAAVLAVKLPPRPCCAAAR